MGTIYDPIAHDPAAFVEATVTASLAIQSIVLDSFGTGYASAPTVAIVDANRHGAVGQLPSTGIISAITVDVAGSGYITPGGIKKFQDGLPKLCNPSVGTSAPCWPITWASIFRWLC